MTLFFIQIEYCFQFKATIKSLHSHCLLRLKLRFHLQTDTSPLSHPINILVYSFK
jgi:hypothetical protein